MRMHQNWLIVPERGLKFKMNAAGPPLKFSVGTILGPLDTHQTDSRLFRANVRLRTSILKRSVIMSGFKSKIFEMMCKNKFSKSAGSFGYC